MRFCPSVLRKPGFWSFDLIGVEVMALALALR